MKRPLILVGGLRPSDVAPVKKWLARVPRPMYLEATSRLRGEAELSPFELSAGEKIISRLDFDGVIRIGHVPTVRYWRDLETSSLPVLNFTDTGFSGLPRTPDVQPLEALSSLDGPWEPWRESERVLDRELTLARQRLLDQFPLSEPAWFRWLSRQIPAQARLFLGNSLPIREWDFAAERPSAHDVYANRGTNGIDGLISTLAGVARGETWGVIGDLSALYDLSGPWAIRARGLEQLHLVVINNSGGQIFHRIFRDPAFLNTHNLNFEHWAKMWSLEYTRLEQPEALDSGGVRVTEIVPSAHETSSFWEEWDRQS